MAEPASAAFAGTQLLTLVPDLAKKFFHWRDMLAENSVEVERLSEDIRSSQDMLDAAFSAYGNVDLNTNMHLSATWPGIKKRLTTLQERLERIKQDCSQLKIQRTTDKIWPSARRDKIKAQSDPLSKLDNAVNDLIFALQPLSVSASSSSTHQDCFVVVKNVPCNPPDVCLDFASKDDNGHPLTYEARLMDAVFDRSERSAIAAVARGSGGVGKTCALRGVGRLEIAENTFEGGILHMVIGADGGLPRLIESIADIVERAGGKQKADRIRSKNTLYEATSLAGEWFQRHPCLFLIDDIWCVNGITRESVHQLTDLARNPRSRIVFTTRDMKVSFDREIEFKERDSHGKQARMILLRCADLPSPTSTDACEAFNEILETCNGLPVALSVCGRAVRQYASRRCAENPENAWVQYWKRFKDHPVLSADGTDTGLRVKRSVLFSLDFINEERNSNLSRRWFTAFCVLRKQQFVPSDVVRRLWGVSNSETEIIMDCLERFSIAQIRCSDSSQKMLIGLHDILLDISREMALGNNELSQWCKWLIASYADDRSGDNSLCGQHIELYERFREWWMQVEDDGYIFKNICWLLKHGKFTETLLQLMFDPEWIIRQLGTNGHRQVVEDVQLTKNFLPGSLTVDEKGQVEEFLTVLQRAVQMSWKETHESNWVGAGSFHLYGRMVHLVDRNKYVQRFLKRVESAAPRPWLRPSAGCLLPAGDALRHVVHVKGSVLSFMQVAETLNVCYKDARCVLVKRHNLDHGTESDAKLVLEAVEEGQVNKVVRCARFSSCGEQLALGMQNGDILLCKLTHEARPSDSSSERSPHVVSAAATPSCRSSEFKCERSTQEASYFRCEYPYLILRGHRDAVLSVKIYENGRRLVSGSHDRTVRVWERKGEKWMGARLERHEWWVECVAMSVDGRWVASASDDNDVTIWKRDGENWVREEHKGHEDYVESVAVNADGRWVVSASRDNTVRVWEWDGEKRISTKLEGHEDEVESVAVNADGLWVASASRDNTVRVWRRDNGNWVSTKLEGHEGRVRSVVVSADGRQVVSGSIDNTVRVWERDGEKWASTKLGGHEGWVQSVSMSTDGRRVISGSDDGTVRIWDREEDKWISMKLEGHEGLVESVVMSADGQCAMIELEGGTRRVWGCRGGKWNEKIDEMEMEEERHGDVLQPPAEQDWRLDDALFDDVVRPLGDRFWNTSFGFFVALNRKPWLVQIDVLWK